MKAKVKYVVGIDEVGRGPLAGPVTVCACLTEYRNSKKFLKRTFSGVRDSKKMQPEAREKLFSVAQKEKRNGSISYAVASVESKKIDAEGIATAITAAVDKSLVKLNVDPLQCLVLLDGGLRAPKRYVYQKTIVRGDDSEPIISLASVIAKVVRDRKMRMYARVYGGYGFEVHKGYGTRHHLDAIDRLGMCAIHRRSFCKKSLQRK